VARSIGLVLKCECKLCGKICYKLHTVLSYLVCYCMYMLYLILSCKYGCQLFGVYLFVVVLCGDFKFTCCSMCVLLSYLFHYVDIAVLVVICVYYCTCCTICVLLVLL
jgi:hypothetical protein